jgi:hypothetical protein
MYQEGLLNNTFEGYLATGEYCKAQIYIPQPLTFLVMKLFAFRDRLNDPNRDYGSYHALDMYTILATTMEYEWNMALELSKQYKDTPAIVEASQLVTESFSSIDQIGMIRLRESPYCNPELQLTEFMSALKELFN